MNMPMTTRSIPCLAALVATASLVDGATMIPNYSTANSATIIGGVFDGQASITNPSGIASDGITIGYGAVGANGPNSRRFHQVAAYRVSDIVTALGLSSISEISGYTFNYSATTEASATDFDNSYSYQVAYAGQWEDTGDDWTNVPLRGTTSNENIENMGNTPSATNAARTLYSNAGDVLSGYAASATLQIVDTGIPDLADTAQVLQGTGFDLSHLATDLAADGDLTNNYVFFSVYLDPPFNSTGTTEQQIFTGVALEAVPEPSIALLGGLGLVGLLRRRR